MKFALHRLRNLPIRRKLILLILVTCSAVLVLALIALFVVQSVTIRADFIRDVTALGRVLAHNSAAAAAFNDREAAAQMLSAIKSRPGIEGACLVLSNGSHVTELDLHRKHIGPMEDSLADGVQEDGSDLLFASPVELDGKRLGTLFLRGDFRPIRARLLGFYGGTLAIVLVVSLFVAFALASRLQHFITAPILHLVGVAQDVGGKGDYAARATKTGNDEVGLLTDAFNEMLQQIQQRDARVEERKRELANSLSLLNATLDSTADGILALQLSGKVLCYNTQFSAMWQVPAGILDRLDGEELSAYLSSKVSHPQAYLDRIRALSRAPEKETFVVVELKDGRVFERYTKAQRVDGKVVGVVVNFRDITARQGAEAETERLNTELVDASRQAGMAEVATSVLHNVGNVLNSVNISATLASGIIRESCSSDVTRVAALFQQHRDDLPKFVTSAQGTQLPAFLTRLAQHLGDEQRSVLAELQSLNGNIDHIKEIVAMQQNYARIAGVTEQLSPASLVEDALRLNAAAFSRHGVQIVREYGEAPLLEVDKHKVLQILVNLLRNAKYAMDEAGGQGKNLTLRIGEDGAGGVKISVADEGVGISAENLTRIFAHGFTTRQEGHGFGLHSAALAAKELGGSLTVHSDGLGRGAVFTLALPRQPVRSP